MNALKGWSFFFPLVVMRFVRVVVVLVPHARHSTYIRLLFVFCSFFCLSFLGGSVAFAILLFPPCFSFIIRNINF